MNRVNKRRLAGGVLLLGLVILLAVVMVNVVADEDAQQPEFLVANTGCNKELIAAQAMREQGFTDEMFVIGENQVNWDAPEANERGSAAFLQVTPKSAPELTTALKSSDERNVQALTTLREQSGASNEQLQDPNNWVAVQFTVDTEWSGNTRFAGATESAGTRSSDEGDALWVFVHPDKCVQVVNGEILSKDAVTGHRAGCGNPQTALPTPTKPPSGGPTPTTSPPVTTTSPPTTTTTTPRVCPPEMPHGTWPICKDDPANDVNNNPAVPPQVKKTQPSADNGSEVAKPPTAPVDSPTGCTGSCTEEPEAQPEPIPKTDAPPVELPAQLPNTGTVPSR